MFVTYRPAWVGPDGFPLSWQHYQYGLKNISLEFLRLQLRDAQAIRMGRVESKEDWTTYQRDISRLTEVPRYG